MGKYYHNVVQIFAWPRSTRRQLAIAAIHIAMLGAAFLFAWGRDGPPADTAFWAVVAYFAEIAIVGLLELIINAIRRSRAKQRRA